MNIELVILIFGCIGTISFAISGSLIAIEKKFDIVGVLILGFINACGGGFLRDVIIGKDIVMFKDPIFPILAFSVALLVFIVLYAIKNLDFIHSKYYRLIQTTIEAIGLGAFVISGAEVAIEHDYHSVFSIVFFSLISSSGGGLLRDICARRLPLIFTNGTFLLSAFLGSLSFILLLYLKAPVVVSSIIPVIVVVLVRLLGFIFKLKLPRVDLIENED